MKKHSVFTTETGRHGDKRRQEILCVSVPLW